MKREDKPEIVDLNRYKQAAQARAQRAAKPKPSREPILGSRPRAGLILLLFVAALAAFWMLSNLR